MTIRSNVFLLLILLLGYGSRAATYEPIVDLEEFWYFNDDEQSYPYVKGNGLSAESIHFQINLKRYSGQYLHIEHAHKGAVFIDGKLAKYDKDKFSVTWNIDSLLTTRDNKEALFTFYSEQKDYDKLQTSISTKRADISGDKELITVQRRAMSVDEQFLIMIIVILIFLAAIVNTNIVSFRIFYSYDNVIFGRVRDDSIYQLKLFSQTNLLLFIFHSAVISFLVLCLDRYADISVSVSEMLTDSLIFNWALLTALFLIAFFAKYLLIKYVGVLFDMGVAANYYFFEFMRMSMAFFFSVFIVASVLIISQPHLSNQVSEIGLNVTLIFMTLRFIVLFFRVGKHAPFKNVHLFSYLCTTETLPIIIGIKYIF